MRSDLVKDMADMEDAMARLATSRDTWQGGVIYAICKAVFHLLQAEIRREKRGVSN